MDNKIEDIFNNDELGLLDEEPKKHTPTSEDRVVSSFLEINDFIRENGGIPQKRTTPGEHKLACRLDTYIQDDNYKKVVGEYDEFNLLSQDDSESFVDQYLENDVLGILEDDDDEVDIFNLSHVPKPSEDRASADFVAKRTKVHDFTQYEEMFVELQDKIDSGIIVMQPFAHGDIEEGGLYVANGLKTYVESLEMDEKPDKNGKVDGRLHCIFDNGTESNMRYRTLQKILEKDGRTIVDFGSVIESQDSEVGYIYILSTQSSDSQISSIQHLYKVGFSKGEIEQRINNAEKDPTYLMAPVKIESGFKCYNMNPQRLERLLHRFFADVKLNIDLTDNNGDRYTPKEWFVAPLSVIEQAIHLIISGEIVHYEYDRVSQTISKR